MSPYLRLVRRVSLFVLLSLLISLVPPTRPQPRPVAAAPASPASAAPRAVAAPARTASCAAAPFGVATDFNVFILGDLIHQFTDTEGRLAVGGHATLESYGVGRQLTADADDTDTLVVGGDLRYTHGEVAHGHVAHGGTASLTNVTLLTGTARQDTPLDFAAAAVALATRAREWAVADRRHRQPLPLHRRAL
jgi:hypothetical protein